MLWAIFGLFAAHATRGGGGGELSGDALDRFHAGDRQVMAELFRTSAPRAVAMLRRSLPRIDAEAVVQEAFVTLLGSEAQRRRFEGGRFSAYLCTMARFRGIDAWRREQRYADSSELPEPADMTSGTEERIAARELLEKFLQRSVPPKQKEYFKVRFIEQKTQVEAAEQLKLKRSTLATWEKLLAERLRKSVVSGEISYVAQGAG